MTPQERIAILIDQNKELARRLDIETDRLIDRERRIAELGAFRERVANAHMSGRDTAYDSEALLDLIWAARGLEKKGGAK